MAKRDKPQKDIARTLNRLLPVKGAPKDLEQIRDQLRLVNEITDPDDARLARIVVRYFRDEQYCSKGTRFRRVDEDLSDYDLDARWTRVRIGPGVWEPTAGARGDPPKPKLISSRLRAMAAACAESDSPTFYLWDFLEEHFGVTRENNRYYREWLEALSHALQTDSRFVIVAVDEETDIPVEWMLATDREEQIHDTVASRIPELIEWMERAGDLVHLTRDLVHRFFSPEVVDDTYDIHAYYKALSTTLAQSPEVIPILVEEGARKIEAWCSTERIRTIVCERLRSVSEWLHSVDTARGVEAISQHLFQSSPQIASARAVRDLVADVLSEDLRFISDAANARWRAVPPGPEENLPAYHVLWRQRRPLAEDVLREKIADHFPAVRTSFNLVDDERFSRYRGETWGLSQWVDVADWAYDYLREQRKPLRVRAIKTRASQDLDIPLDLVIFAPEDDPRFVRRPKGRWYYRHALSESELDQMLTLLDTAENGLTLHVLVGRATGLDAPDTDAAERLVDDERFILLDGRWFARDKVVYSLTDGDLDQLLKTLRRKGTGLRLTTLVKEGLGREARLTDAQQRLQRDSRFREIVPDVWVAADLEPPSEDRTSIFNRPIRSEKVPVVPEDEYTVVEELTERERQPRGKRSPVSGHQITRTLSLLDVQRGNLLLDRAIAGLLPQDCDQAVHFTDELGDEFTAWRDEENDLLQGFGAWFKTRQLTFGDKVTIRRSDEPGVLQIVPTGQRDERVHQEALERQNVENLIQEAREVGKSYHDLMIEVMETFNQAAGEPVPLHRDDIYDLVNHKRTASRSYIFSLLSLTDCPYEELRYFVPHGDGYWSFDPGRRKAFEMKMRQLVEQVEQLEAEKEHLEQSLVSVRAIEEEQSALVDSLAGQSRKQASRIAELSAENDSLSEANERLKSENETLLEPVGELEARVSALEAQAADQATELDAMRSERETLTRELADVLEERAALQGKVEGLVSQRTTMQDKIEELEGRVEALANDLNRVRSEREALAKKLGAIREERDELRKSQRGKDQEIDLLAQEKTTLEQEHTTLQVRLETLASENATIQERVGQLQDQVDTLTNEKASQQQQYDEARAALESLAQSSEASQERLQKELDLERRQGRQLHEHLQALERTSAAKAEESAQLGARLDRARAGLHTPLGKGFVGLLRVLGGPDLSDL